MKHVIHTPTADFAYVETEFEQDQEDVAMQHHRYIVGMEKSGPGLATFKEALDEYLTTGALKNGTELWQEMNDNQRFVFQEIKKSKQRTK